MRQTYFDFWEEKKTPIPEPIKATSSPLEVFKDIREHCATVGSWDYLHALGDTILEKYESLYAYMVEASDIIQQKSGQYCNFIVVSSEVSAIFECATAGYSPNPNYDGDDFGYLGDINQRWRIYKSINTPVNQMILGVNSDGTSLPFFGNQRPDFQNDFYAHSRKYALINLQNFAIL